MQLKSGLLLVALSSLVFTASAQFSEKTTVKQLKKDIKYLASDKLEGRRTGSEGERMAADYLIDFYTKAEIPGYTPKVKAGEYRHPFTFTVGRTIGEGTIINIGGTKQTDEDAFPLAFSSNGSLSGEVKSGATGKGDVWMIPMFADADQAKDPHYYWEKNAFETCEKAVKAGATGVVFYDQFDAKYAATFNKRSEYEALSIPVVYITNKGYKAYVEANIKKGIKIAITTDIKEEKLTGNNVLAYIDNNAAYTVVLGAHYDHLGHGEDGNSLDAKKEGAIHNGADDNASGTAALMQLARRVKEDGLRKYNYLFMHFSAEELGLIGSKKIVEQLGLDSSNVAYMMNMDMVGRLKDSTHALSVGGLGTSPQWGKVVNVYDERFKIVVDSSGVGPSDHSSFYYKNIPVLFFFTGTHKDYHKPSDDANKINYTGEAQVIDYIYGTIKKLDFVPRPTFTPTKQKSVGKVRFKVTLGVMPDYSFTDGGLRIDGVTEGRPASIAGIKGGDIITQMGDFDVRGIQTYMEALSAYEVGDEIEVTVKRDGKEITMPLKFIPKKKK